MTTVGIVKLYLPHKNYGFLSPSDGSKDVFFTRNSIEGGVDLREGETVEYDLASSRRIPQASRVRPARRESAGRR